MKVFYDVLPEFSLMLADRMCHDGENFSWSYYKSIAVYEKDKNEQPYHERSVYCSGFTHLFCYLDKNQKFIVKSIYWEILKPVVEIICNKVGVDFNKIFRCKFNLTTPQPEYKEGSFSVPHIDYSSEHTVVLFYANQSNGDTVIFNEKFNGNGLPEKVSIKKEVPVVKNSAVVFDGYSFHSAGIPTKYKERITLNMNFFK